MKLVKILIILALIFFPFGELLRFEIGKNIAIRPLEIVVGLAAAWSTIIFFTKKLYIKYSFIKPLLFFIGIGVLSLGINSVWLQPQELLASSLYLIRWTSYALLLFIVLHCDTAFKKLISKFLFVDGLLLVVFGYFQYFFYPSLKPLYHLGWDEHMYRMFSTFFDPNFAGAFFVLYFLFIAGWLYHFIQKRKKKESIILSIILLVTLLAVFLTFSRAAFLMLIAGSTVFLFLINQKRLIFAILGAIALFAISFSSQFYIENINLFREASSKARLENYSVALKIIQDRPLLGVGFNTYRYAKDLYGIQTQWTHFPSHADAGVDNSFLFVFATTGTVGFIAYVWFLLAIVTKTFIVFKKHARVSSLIILSSLAGLCINALFINSFFFPAIIFWMWMIVGLSEEKE